LNSRNVTEVILKFPAAQKGSHVFCICVPRATATFPPHDDQRSRSLQTATSVST
jgi:hypothetical protein